MMFFRLTLLALLAPTQPTVSCSKKASQRSHYSCTGQQARTSAKPSCMMNTSCTTHALSVWG